MKTKILINFVAVLAAASCAQGQTTLTTLASFANTNGAGPASALTLGSDGNFYGATELGGYTNLNNGQGWGTVFRVTTNGVLTTLYSFSGNDGGYGYGYYPSYPSSALILGNDGNLYGTTELGGYTNLNNGYGWGTMFKITTNGVFTSLYSFTGGSDGGWPNGLTLGNDGNFYGTTEQGGNTDNFNSYDYGYIGNGTIFKVTTNGVLTTLYTFTNGFDPYSGNDVEDGGNPAAALTLGNDGNFYGTTQDGSTNNGGTIFQVTTNGVLTTFYSLDAISIFGRSPAAALTLGNDGSFYGTTEYGGNGSNLGNGWGVAFKFTTNGIFDLLYIFPGSTGFASGQPGQGTGLTLAGDGNFYGTTYYGGNTNLDNGAGDGVVFQITPAGNLTILNSFRGDNGAYPLANLTLGSDGNLYGTTFYGGYTNLDYGLGYGTVFKLSFPQPPPPNVLGITTVGNFPVVVWAVSATSNYVLQTTADLAAGNWVDVTNGIPFTGIMITNGGSAAFFRLH